MKVKRVSRRGTKWELCQYERERRGRERERAEQSKQTSQVIGVVLEQNKA